VFEPLRAADYRRLWIGQVVSVIGDKINQIAMAMMVYAVTGSMLQMGIMLGVTFLPAALFGLPAGVYVDRWDRRLTMVSADLIRAVLIIAIPFVVRFGVGWAYLIAFAVSTVSVFFLPAKRASIPELVPAEQLMAANSLDNGSESVAELSGLAMGGALVALLGYRGAFAIDALTFVFSAVMIFRMRYRQPARLFESEEASVFAEAVEGLRYIWDSDVLRQLSTVYVFSAVLGSASIAICYALAFVRYNAGAPGLALLDAGIAVGALLGSAAVARSGPSRPGLKFLLGVGGFGLTFMLISLASSIWFAVGLLVLGGIANMWFFIPATTIYQTRTAGQLRGRVMAAYATASRIAMVVGIVAAGAAVDRISIPLMVAATGAAGVLVAALGFTQTALRRA
jgi:MFS family permease